MPKRENGHITAVGRIFSIEEKHCNKNIVVVPPQLVDSLRKKYTRNI